MTVTFFQNELPYDPPSQAAWMSAPGHEGYPALLVGPEVKSFSGPGWAPTASSTRASTSSPPTRSRCPTTPGVRLHDLLTIFLDPANGKGGIRNVVNGVGGSSTIANPDVPVTVVDYP